MKNAIGYVRRSSDKQEESLSQQRDQLQQYAQTNGLELVAIFEDDAISGSDMDRPGLRQLIDTAKTRNDVDAVLTWDRNRLARPKDALDGMMLERQLLQAGKRVIYAGTGREAGRGFQDDLLSMVEHHQNGDYLRKLSRDTMRGTVDRAKRGYWPGGPIPFGYDRLITDEQGNAKRIIRDMEDGTQVMLDPESGEVVERFNKGRRYKKQDYELCTLIPSTPERQRAVRRMFEDFAAGKGTRHLREMLNDGGFRTSRGSMFTVQTIIPILENQAYVGRCTYNKRTLSKWHRYEQGKSVERHDEGVEKRGEDDWIIKDDAWPALVDVETFEKVQQRRKDTKQRNTRAQGRSCKSNYLLTGLIYCGVCGAKMTGHTMRNQKGYETRYYVCSAHHAGRKDKCPKRYTVPAGVVEKYIINLITTDLYRLKNEDHLHKLIADELRNLSGHREDNREQLQRRLATLDQQTAKLRDHLLSLDPDTAKGLGLYDQARMVSEEKTSIEAELEELKAATPKLPDADLIRQRAIAAFDDLQRIVEHGTLEEKRYLMSLYAQKIEADPDSQQVRISLYPALFSSVIAGSGFEPLTSGL